ncbi:exocyst complex component 8-like [Ptychodera flava]|uniref:exocyst complex component 8-like n=1 Tax=Ptychodera flava TaxID=63121 RepID=UPI003969F99E
MAQSGIKQQLSDVFFDADKYVRDISSGGDGHKDLLDHRRRVQNLNDETAVAMKKNVYKNYTQFIETGKEISLLESEMYQLSHILTEQKTLVGQFLDMSISAASDDGQSDDASKKEKDEKKKTLTSLLEKVEGLTGITEVPGRYLIHEGDLVELETNNFTEIAKVHAFLLNDGLLVTTYIPNRRGPLQYKFQRLFELDNLAVVNARDVGPVKNAFKVLMFPEQHMYQCSSPKIKREWLDCLEKTKKLKTGSSSSGHKKDTISEQYLNDTFDRSNPFYEGGGSYNVPSDTNPLQVDWLLELPEDLDVCIAQRDFEGAVDLIEKTYDHITTIPSSPALKEFRARLDHRVQQLTEVLIQEMEVTADRSLRGGPGITRRAVMQLIRLGKHTTACSMFLKHRTAAIKLAVRKLKIEGATSVYTNKLCSIFFTHLIETGKEFQKAFADKTGCFSAFVVWTKQELQTFVGHFSNQAFASKSNLDTVAECINIARRHCQKICNIGLDLSFVLDSLLLKGIRDTIRYNKDQLMEAVKHRIVDEKWRPTNMQNPHAASQLAQEMVQYGIHNFNSQIYDKCWVSLSTGTIMFAKSYMNFLNNLMSLYIPELYYDTVDSLNEVLKHYIETLASFATNERYMHEREFILKNVDFMFQTIVPLTENKAKEVIGHQVRPFKGLYEEQKKINASVESLGVLI